MMSKRNIAHDVDIIAYVVGSRGPDFPRLLNHDSIDIRRNSVVAGETL